jgi:anti-sigma-K factor RskA
MTNDEDIDGLAAEYALGSLSLEERQEVDARRKADRTLSEAVDAWEKRLGTLSDGAPGIEPPPHLFAQIAHELWGQGDQIIQFTEFASLRRSSRRWRAIGLSAGALAACLAMIVVWLFQDLPAKPTTHPAALIAVLQRAADRTTADEGTNSQSRPAFVVSIDLKARSIVVSPVTARPVPRRSYELWLMQGRAATPSSLGVISQSEATTVPWRAGHVPDDFVDATLAVSLEPEGGSSTGMPAGPIAFVGKLVQP